MTNQKNNGKASVAEATAKNGTAPKASIVNNPQAPKTVKPVEQSRPTIEEQMKYFAGLEILVTKCRRLEKHKAAIEVLDLSEDDLNQFENSSNYGPHIELHDSNRKEYTINNPRLLAEVKDFLIGRLGVKIAEFEELILTYGN